MSRAETVKCPICGKPLLPLGASTLHLTPTCNHDVARIWLEEAKKRDASQGEKP